MPEGILIDYNDGRPAMAITAGLRAPSFCTSFAGYGTGANQFQVNTPLTSGSTVFVLPTRPVDIQEFVDNQTWIVLPIYMTSVTRNGDSGVTINGTNKGNYQRIPNWAGTVFEILPAATYNEGLLVSDSTDFTAISNRASLMTCAYSGTVTVNDSMALPVSGIPFGKWNNNNVSVGFDGANLIVRDINYSGRDDVAASVTMELVIFNNTAPVAGDGITMINPSGQVTFSTVKRPFVYDQQLTVTDNNQYIGDKYCQIVFTGAQSRRVDGYFNIRKKGVVMSGGNIRSAYNQVVGNYNDNRFDMSFIQNINMPILVLPDMY
ncbi:hypothetical protein QJ279_001805 [Salmonella enterica]|nr:hypothetical protein [Salmonella enterica]ELX4921272.1 hypothetical protein [Salmonella enterica]